MSSASRNRLYLVVALLAAAGAGACSRSSAAVEPPSFAPGPAVKPLRLLRVCSDPNNLPFSNQELE